MKMVSKMRAGNLCATALLPATTLVASPFCAIPARRVASAIAAAVRDRAQIVARVRRNRKIDAAQRLTGVRQTLMRVLARLRFF